MPHTHTVPKTPTSFLSLPRELRDEIYTYALLAPSLIDIGICLPSPPSWYTPNPHHSKPPTPSLFRANKQIHHEATDILYKKNTFRFDSPGHFWDFEQQISAESCKLIRSIDLWFRFPGADEIVIDYGDMLPSEYDSVPSHWIAVMDTCALTRVKRLAISAAMSGCEPDKVQRVLRMPDYLGDFIVEFWGEGGMKGFRVWC